MEASTGNTPGKNRIPSLDGLRGIAILLVLIGHGGYALPHGLAPILPFAGNGLLGVSIFFVLSGFLIYSLSVRELEKTGSFDWRQFYLRRVLRIFPCFYFYLLVLVALMAANWLTLTQPMLFSAATFSLNYRHLWDHGTELYDYFVIGHYWTLALEEQFYLTWPLLMLLFLRKRLLPALVLIIALAPVMRFICYYVTPGSRAQLTMMFHTAFDSIAAGVLLAELLRRPAFRTKLEQIARQGLWLGASLLFLFIFSPLLTAQFLGSYLMTIGRSLELAAICLIITAAISFPGTWLYKILNWRPLAWLGVLSYSLYVWNNLFLYSAGRWTVNQFPFNYLCLFATAIASHYLIEKPFLNLKDRLRESPQNKNGDGSKSIAA